MDTQYLDKKDIDEALNKQAAILSYDRGFTWGWNSALKTTMGLAYGSRRHIEFSPLCFIPATPFQRVETIAHELAHIVRWWQHYDGHTNNIPIHEHLFRNKRGHDNEWRFLMYRLGFNGSRCHTVIPLGSKRRR